METRGLLSEAARQRQQEIDEEIRKLECSVVSLKSRRNALASIAILPPELLSRIFTFVSSAYKNELIYHYSAARSFEWFKVSHVSSHWRSVALGCPALWTSIPLSSPSWTAEMLKRSKIMTFTVHVDLTAYNVKKLTDSVKLAFAHTKRIEKLHLTAPNRDLINLFPLLESPALALHSLVLSNSRPYESAVSLRLPDAIFNGQVPMLKVLELNGCQPSWDSPLLKAATLTSLTIRAFDFRPDIHQLINILSNTIALEQLSVSNCLPAVAGASISAPAPSKVIVLPKLNQVDLVGTVLECASFLNYLSLPNLSILKLDCKATPATGDDFSSIFSALSSIGDLNADGGMLNKPIRKLSLSQPIYSSLAVEAWFYKSAVNRGGPHIIITFSQLSTAKSPVGLVPKVLRRLSLHNLRTLKVMMPRGGLDEQLWFDSGLSALKKLCTVHVDGDSALSLIRRLSVDSDGIAGYNDYILRGEFPALRDLTLQRLDFDTMSEELVDCLMERCERRMELWKLTLLECQHLPTEEVEELEKIVVEVDWDLDEGFTDDEASEDEYDSEEDYYRMNLEMDPDDYEEEFGDASYGIDWF